MPQKLFFAFIWPYLYKLVAKKAANFLQERRDRRLHGDPLPTHSECPPCPPCPQLDEQSAAASAPKVWYTLAGVLLGSVFSAVVFFILRQMQPST